MPTAPTIDSTDVGALLHQQQATRPYIEQRVLEYYGNPQIKNIIPVVGLQIHAVTQYGVWITENGPYTQRTLIPWSRVHSLTLAPSDPLYNKSND